ncbi:MAG TPA: STAS domain-containing protein [Gaiellaceae bacterium]|nr:STAS domain-containing protein [Gaiellaceae bacterium]
MGVNATTTQVGADAYVVSVAGELDIATAGRLREELERAIGRGARRVIVDLIGLTFIDSVALGVLTEGARRLRADGGVCVVVSQDPRILRVFEITGLDRVFRIERSLAEAVEEVIGGLAAE